jgi:hypothetical protein
MRHILVLMVLTGWLAVVASPVRASPILWTLTDVTFDDGGTASGSFVFEDVTGAYSDLSITSTAGSSFAGATYAAPNPIFHPNRLPQRLPRPAP